MRRHAWLAVSVALMSSTTVTAVWAVHAANNILAEMQAGVPSVEVANRFQKAADRLKSGELTVTPSSETKSVRHGLALAALSVREHGDVYRHYSELTLYLLRTVIAVFVLQLGVAISGFFGKRSGARSPNEPPP